MEHQLLVSQLQHHHVYVKMVRYVRQGRNIHAKLQDVLALVDLYVLMEHHLHVRILTRVTVLMVRLVLMAQCHHVLFNAYVLIILSVLTELTIHVHMNPCVQMEVIVQVYLQHVFVSTDQIVQITQLVRVYRSLQHVYVETDLYAQMASKVSVCFHVLVQMVINVRQPHKTLVIKS